MTQTAPADGADENGELLWLVLAQLCGALKLPLERANDLADLRVLLCRLDVTSEALGAREDALRGEGAGEGRKAEGHEHGERSAYGGCFRWARFRWGCVRWGQG